MIPIFFILCFFFLISGVTANLNPADDKNSSFANFTTCPPTVCETCTGTSAGIKNIETTGSAENLNEQEIIKKIEDINTTIKDNGWNWTAGVTSVSNLTPDAYQKRLGLIHPAKQTTVNLKMLKSQILEGEGLKTSVILPAAFDWRNNNGDFTTPVKDQDICGSCWAFAVTAAFESYWERLNNNPDINPDFSEQYLVSCDSRDQGCSGGDNGNAMPYFVDQEGRSGGIGTVDEANFSYIHSNGTCINLSGFPRYKVPEGGNWLYVNSSDQVPTDEELKTAIFMRGPVSVYINATANFGAYRGGIFDDTGTGPTTHAIVLVGWGYNNTTNRTFWIGKNSWGTGWGEAGWIRVYSGVNLLGEGAAYFSFPPPNISSVSPSSGYTGSTVTVTNISGTYFIRGATVNLTLSGSPDIPAANVTVVSGNRITATFNLAGTASGQWNVVEINPDEQTGTLPHGFEIVPPPIVDFTSNATWGIAPLAVEFSDTSGWLAPAAWNWSFGDGGWFNTTDTASRNPAHSYASLGSYNVSLTVRNASGQNTTLRQDYISVQMLQTPQADITADSTSGGYNLSVRFFDNTTVSKPDTWLWDFGDGSTSALQNPIHWFNQTNDTRLWYTISLRAGNVSYGSNLTIKNRYIHTLSFSEYYRNISTTIPPGNISGFTFSGTIEDYRVQRDVSAFTIKVPGLVFSGLIEDYRLQRQLL